MKLYFRVGRQAGKVEEETLYKILGGGTTGRRRWGGGGG